MADDPQTVAPTATTMVDEIGAALDGLTTAIGHLEAVVGRAPWHTWARKMAARLDTERGLLAVIHRDLPFPLEGQGGQP